VPVLVIIFMDELLVKYEKLKPTIKKRLKEFKEIGKNETNLFAELCFCLCTPQSSAFKCDNAIQNLIKLKLLENGSEDEVKEVLVKAGVRFHHNKAGYIVAARKLNKELINQLKSKNEFEIREWLVKNVKGFGLKESGHFLRNIGRYEHLTILDRHILRNLVKYGAIKRIPDTLTAKRYLVIEKKMKAFAVERNIPHAELDLLFWADAVGKVFK